VDAAVISNAPRRITCFGPFLPFLARRLGCVVRVSNNVTGLRFS
jgi:hypothetical protein